MKENKEKEIQNEKKKKEIELRENTEMRGVDVRLLTKLEEMNSLRQILLSLSLMC